MFSKNNQIIASHSQIAMVFSDVQKARFMPIQSRMSGHFKNNSLIVSTAITGLLILSGCQGITSSEDILTSDTDCPTRPRMTLTSEHIQPTNLTSEIQIFTPSASSDQAIGYIFLGRIGQQLAYYSSNACIWVFTPMMNIMHDNILPEDGQYIIQIEKLSNNQNIQIELGLDVVHQDLDSQQDPNEYTSKWDFPLQECGDSNPDGLQTFYPVFVNQTDEDILNHIKATYCQDAFFIRREDDDERFIQIASFRDREKAQSFIETIRKDPLVDALEIGSERQL